jgi:hypothetical protein
LLTLRLLNQFCASNIGWELLLVKISPELANKMSRFDVSPRLRQSHTRRFRSRLLLHRAWNGIQQVAQKEVPYTIVMNKYDGSISSNFQSSKVISDDEVIDPESPEGSPIRRQQNK